MGYNIRSEKKPVMKLFTKNRGKKNEPGVAGLMASLSYDAESSLEPLYDAIGDARIVLLGEASHGTHEYYTWRSRITQHLVKEKGFNIIGVEGDWPDVYRINRYVKNYPGSENSSLEVLKQFRRWPSWMWANWEVAALMEWLKAHNRPKTWDQQSGFYGLDVYSLWESLEAVMGYLKKHDPDAVATAQKALECLEPYHREGSDYAAATRFVSESCQNEVLELLNKIRSRAVYYDGDREAPFNVEQNALTAVNAERYYRSMIAGGSGSWNIRDTHMSDTLEKLLEFHGEGSKAVVWEHNTHIGDARATDMGRSGIVNVGQLVRERWGREACVLVGIGSYQGSVIAGRSWGAPMEEMKVPEAREGSWEAVLHETTPASKLIITSHMKDKAPLKRHFDHRAIGVVYRPEMERHGNYVPSLISDRYDAFLFLDKTRALHPITSKADLSMTPDTYPWGL